MNDQAERLASITVVMQDVGQPLVKAAQNDARDRALAALLLSGVGGVSGGIAGYMRGGEKRKRKALLGALLGAGVGAGTPYLHKALSGGKDQPDQQTSDEPLLSEEDQESAKTQMEDVEGDSIFDDLGLKLTRKQQQGASLGLGGLSGVPAWKIAPWIERQVGKLRTGSVLRAARQGHDPSQSAVRTFLETGGAAGGAKWKELGYNSADDFMAKMVADAPKTRSMLSRLFRGSKRVPAEQLGPMGLPVKPKAVTKSMGQFFESVARNAKKTTGAIKTPGSIAQSFRHGVRGAGAKTLLPKAVGWAARLGIPLAVGLKTWPDASSRLVEDLNKE